MGGEGSRPRQSPQVAAVLGVRRLGRTLRPCNSFRSFVMLSHGSSTLPGLIGNWAQTMAIIGREEKYTRPPWHFAFACWRDVSTSVAGLEDHPINLVESLLFVCKYFDPGTEEKATEEKILAKLECAQKVSIEVGHWRWCETKVILTPSRDVALVNGSEVFISIRPSFQDPGWISERPPTRSCRGLALSSPLSTGSRPYRMSDTVATRGRMEDVPLAAAMSSGELPRDRIFESILATCFRFRM